MLRSSKNPFWAVAAPPPPLPPPIAPPAPLPLVPRPKKQRRILGQFRSLHTGKPHNRSEPPISLESSKQTRKTGGQFSRSCDIEIEPRDRIVGKCIFPKCDSVRLGKFISKQMWGI